MSNAADDRLETPHGTSLLPCDLSPEQMMVAPTLATIDVLLIEGLTQLEDEAFAAALRS